MNDRRLADIRARREQLVRKAAAQRDEAELLLAPLGGPLRVADRGIAAVEYVRAHPGVVIIAAGVILVLSPKRALRWLRRGFAIWRGYRFAVRALNEIAP